MDRVAGLLRLEVRDYEDLTRWSWVLIDEASGAEVATHDVRLHAADERFDAFTDLHQYLSLHVAPDRRGVDDAHIIAKLGEWIGTQVLGPVVHVLAERARRGHLTVRVIAPPGLLFRPLELAYMNGEPLATQDVTLVMQPDESEEDAAPRGRLRILGLFSQPEGERALNLRRERYELVRRIAATGKAAEVRVLQYGVTREALREVLTDGDGWDIIHISGHGRPGELLLETAEGNADLLDGAHLADLLAPVQHRVRLVTVSACWSAAVAADEQRRVLGLRVTNEFPPEAETGPDAAAGTASGTLATSLVARLGCAVLAMRYPVEDEFAMALTGRLYELLIDSGQPLPNALSKTLRELRTASAQAATALLKATPALFGSMAADLRLVPPARSEPEDDGPMKMAGFPAPEPRFVGRTGVMARASAALAARSDVQGVLLHGMPGGGKTACAIELAYSHEHAFEHLIWYKAPDEGKATDGALTDFALTLNPYLDDFELGRGAPKLTELMQHRRLLIVIDNAESLLSDTGDWRDEQWRLVLDALTAHTGPGRVLLTSRRVPATGLTRLSVDALSADEALLLMRELPGIQGLARGPRLAHRQLARRALEVAQGHPKLLDLAERQAANPERLAALLEVGDRAWRELGSLPEGFFTDGESAASRPDYLQVLAAWTKSITESLSPAEGDLFGFLCCLEEADRIPPVLANNWEDLRNRLGRTGQLPDLDRAVAAIVGQGLVSIPPNAEKNRKPYAVHPAIASCGRDLAGPEFQEAVDIEISLFWESVFRRASGDGEGTVNTAMLVWAGLSAVPYLIRQQRWDDAAELLQGAMTREPSRANAVAMLPAIRRIARHDPHWTGAEAGVLRVINPAQGENLLRTYLADMVAEDDYRAASVAAGHLADWCRDSGRLIEALSLVELKIGYTLQGGFGPWTRLGDQTLRLQVLNSLGQNSRVLAEARKLRDQMDTLPAVPGTEDGYTTSWHVRETLLENGHIAAQRLAQWTDTLEWNAARLAGKHTRHATSADIARTRFNDYFPLLRLGRIAEALELLLDCRQVFEDADDRQMLGKTLSALADAEDERGHGAAAIQLERDALRYKYLANDLNDIVTSYHNLGNYLRRHARQPVAAYASHLASGLIERLMGIQDQASVRAAANDLRALGSVPIASVADLCRQLGDIPGTDLPGLIAKLSTDPQTAERTLRNLLAQAR